MGVRVHMYAHIHVDVFRYMWWLELDTVYLHHSLPYLWMFICMCTCMYVCICVCTCEGQRSVLSVFLSHSSFMCVCSVHVCARPCICAYVHKRCMYMYACARGNEKLTSRVFLSHSPAYFLRQGLSLSLEFMNLLSWLASKLQEFICLYFPFTRVTDVCNHKAFT